MTNKRGHFSLILILGSLTALSPFSIDMYLPAFPQIAEDLRTSVAQVSLSLSSYFIGLAVGQIFYGPLLDRFGRKKPLYVGLTIFILASIGALTSRSIESLVIFRFLQALGGCVAQVAAVAMVRDFFPVQESSKIFSFLMLILGVSPLLAPTVGGFVASSLGWHWVFILLGLIAFALLLVCRFLLPEGHEPDETVSLRPKPIYEGFVAILKTPQFYTYAVSGALAFAGLFSYVAGSPIIFMDVFKVSPTVYGGIFAGLSVGFIGASQVNVVLLRRYRSEQILKIALIGQTFFGLTFLLGTLRGWYGLEATIVMLFLFLSCVGFANPNAAALALAPFSRNAGSASALMGFVQIGLGSIASAAIGVFGGSGMLPVVSLFAISAVSGLTMFLVGRRRIVAPVEISEERAMPGH